MNTFIQFGLLRVEEVGGVGSETSLQKNNGFEGEPSP